MLDNREGNSAASAYAVRAPQSCPTKASRRNFNASAKSMTSCANATACPLRRGLRDSRNDRNEVGPYPRRYGTIVRYPAACRCGTTPVHVRGESGHPCNRITGNPFFGPPSSYARFRTEVFIRFVLIFSIRCDYAPIWQVEKQKGHGLRHTPVHKHCRRKN